MSLRSLIAAFYYTGRLARGAKNIELSVPIATASDAAFFTKATLFLIISVLSS